MAKQLDTSLMEPLNEGEFGDRDIICGAQAYLGLTAVGDGLALALYRAYTAQRYPLDFLAWPAATTKFAVTSNLLKSRRIFISSSEIWEKLQTKNLSFALLKTWGYSRKMG